jgi:hypothetical protein
VYLWGFTFAIQEARSLVGQVLTEILMETFHRRHFSPASVSFRWQFQLLAEKCTNKIKFSHVLRLTGKHSKYVDWLKKFWGEYKPFYFKHKNHTILKDFMVGGDIWTTSLTQNNAETGLVVVECCYETPASVGHTVTNHFTAYKC